MFREFQESIEDAERCFEKTHSFFDRIYHQTHVFYILSEIKNNFEEQGYIKELIQLLNVINNNTKVMCILGFYQIYIAEWIDVYNTILEKNSIPAIRLDEIVESFLLLSTTKPKKIKKSLSKKGRKGFEKRTSSRKRKKKVFF
jgi:hypothetical protein